MYRMMYKTNQLMITEKSTHATFMSVGFGMLGNETNYHSIIMQMQEQEVCDYNIYIKSVATHTWSLSRTLLFFLPTLLKQC